MYIRRSFSQRVRCGRGVVLTVAAGITHFAAEEQVERQPSVSLLSKVKTFFANLSWRKKSCVPGHVCLTDGCSKGRRVSLRTSLVTHGVDSPGDNEM